MTETREVLARVADAIEAARCPDREGPYGLYDYSGYCGAPRPHRVRDFRDPGSPDWGRAVFSSDDEIDARIVFKRLTREHIAQAAIDAYRAAKSEEAREP